MLQLLYRNASWSFAAAVYVLVATVAIYGAVVSHLSTQALGVWSIVSAATALGRLSDFAISAAHQRAVAVAIANEQKELLGQILLRGVVTAALLTIPLVGVSTFITVATSAELLRGVIDTRSFWVLLLFAAGASVIGSVALVVASSFDGLQTTRTRAKIGILAMTANAAIVYALVGRLGILSLAVGQAVQYALTVGIALTLIRRRYLAGVRSVGRPLHLFKDLRVVGALQLTAGCQQVFEYLAKYLLLRFGSADVVGLFEIALRVILGVRQLITSGLSVLLPYAAHESARQSDGQLRACMLATVTTVVLALAGSLVVIGMGHTVLAVMGAGTAPELRWLLAITCIAWISSLWAAPLFYTVLGEGSVRVPTAAAATMLGLLALAGPPSGVAGGWQGVMIAYATAIWLATAGTILGIRDSRARVQYVGWMRGTLVLYGLFSLEVAALWKMPSDISVSEQMFSVTCALAIFGLVSWVVYSRELRAAVAPMLQRTRP